MKRWTLLLIVLLLCGAIAFSEEADEAAFTQEEILEECVFEMEETEEDDIPEAPQAYPEEEPVPMLPKSAEEDFVFALERTVLGVGEIVPLTNDAVFTVSNPKICTVRKDGTLKALRAGDCVLTATAGDVQTEIPLTVVKAPTKVKVTAPRKALGVGESVLPAAALNNGNVSACTFTSSNSKVLRAEADGSFTAVGKGKAYIVAKAYNGKKGSLRITVTAAPTKLSFPAGTLEMAAEDTRAFAAAADSVSAITYTVENEDVLSVDAKGVFHALSAGTTNVTAKTYNGVTAACTVTVSPALESVVPVQARCVYGVGEIFMPMYTVLPADCLNPTIAVRSLNRKVAAVQKDGRIKALRTGTAVIEVVPYRGETAQITVEVVKAPTKVTLTAPRTVLAKGQEIRLTCGLNNGNGSLCTFTSSNPKVLSVDADGNVTAQGVGSATITAKSYNKKTARVKLSVVEAPTCIQFNFPPCVVFTNPLIVGEGDTIALNPTTDSKAGNLAVLESSNPACVSVDAAGRIHCDAVGEARITAKTYNGLSETLNVRVEKGDEELKFINCPVLPWVNPGYYTLELERGQPQDITCVPSNLEICSLTLTAQDTKILAVSGTRVTGKRAGETTLTITLYDGRTCRVLVTVA